MEQGNKNFSLSAIWSSFTLPLVWSARVYGQFSLDKMLTLQAGSTVVAGEHVMRYMRSVSQSVVRCFGEIDERFD